MPYFSTRELLTDEQVPNAPIAILGTKSDLSEAINEERLGDLLGLFSATNAVKELFVYTDKCFFLGYC